jgi:hypothetical protein
MTFFIVTFSGGAWSNDDVADAGVLGVYSTRDLAQEAVRKMMLDELESSMECGEVEEDIGRAAIERLPFEELEKKWSDALETNLLTIVERLLDGPLLDIHDASSEQPKPCLED